MDKTCILVAIWVLLSGSEATMGTNSDGDSFVSLVLWSKIMLLHVRAGVLASATPERFPALAEPRSIAVPRGYTCQRPITLGDLY